MVSKMVHFTVPSPGRVTCRHGARRAIKQAFRHKLRNTEYFMHTYNVMLLQGSPQEKFKAEQVGVVWDHINHFGYHIRET